MRPILAKYLLVHGGLSWIDGKNAKVVPLGWEIMVQGGATAFHQYDVPILSNMLISFFCTASLTRAPFGPSIMSLLVSRFIWSRNSKLAERLPVVVSHGA